jgi:formylglycine-generating enzyme required for sulfatase activity
MKQEIVTAKAGASGVGLIWSLQLFLTLGIPVASHGQTTSRGVGPENLVLISGGTFQMGDTFGEGDADERPVHSVTLTDFYLQRHEVTVAQFRTFVEETGYRTSAEGPMDLDARRKIMEQFTSGAVSEEEMKGLHQQFLRLSGAGYWDAEARAWTGYNPHTNWWTPGFVQAEDHPVVSVSWEDAIRFCNWLSRNAGLPPAYDGESGVLLDEGGQPTSDVTVVMGYRLPTEAEWEYAAREGGREVRFGNGENTARSSQIVFNADFGEYPYLERGAYEGPTLSVGSYQPNALGLYDMSGNAWEWVSDIYGPYDEGSQRNPYVVSGDERILRGGRWGGSAFEIRTTHRSSWPRNDRCNNSGFRVARSVGKGE